MSKQPIKQINKIRNDYIHRRKCKMAQTIN